MDRFSRHASSHRKANHLCLQCFCMSPSLLLLDLFLPLPVLLSLSLSLSLSTPSLICIDCLFQEADVNTGNNHTQAVAKSLASSNDPPPILISAKIEEEVYLPSPHPLSTFYSLAYPHLHLTHILPHFSPPCHPSSLSSLLPPSPPPLSLLPSPSPLSSSSPPSPPPPHTIPSWLILTTTRRNENSFRCMG